MIGIKYNGRRNDNYESEEKVFITYEAIAGNVIQLPCSVKLNGADDDVCGNDYAPATEEAQKLSTISGDTDKMKPGIKYESSKLALQSHRNSQHVQAQIDEHFKTIAKSIGIPELYVCNVCNVAYKNEMEIENHMKIHDLKYFPCSQCNEIFSSRYSLGNHSNTKHRKIEYDRPTFKFDEAQALYLCDICSAEYQNQSEIEEHLKRHENNFKCTICSENFQKAYDLGVHSVIHYGDKMFRCPLCYHKTSKKRALLSHINCMHLNNVVYTCKICGKDFLHRLLHEEHQNEHLGVKPFTCVVCEKAFTYSSYLLSHQRGVHRVNIGEIPTNQCTICKTVFSKPASLKNHFNMVHEKKHSEKKYLCEICAKGFSKQFDLSIHYRSHTGAKPFSCTYCDKKFVRVGHLNAHKRVHSGEKPFACEYCEKCFSQRGQLKIHQRSHTGEKPYVCQFCNRGFAAAATLYTHRKSCKGEI